MTIDVGSPEVKISEAIQCDADCTYADLLINDRRADHHDSRCAEISYVRVEQLL